MNHTEIPGELIPEGFEDYDSVELSAEDIVNLPHDTAVKVVEYILSKWYDAVHGGEKA